MNPRLMLSLWRERWGKAAGVTFKVPYVRGKVNQWTQWLPHSAAWSVTGVSAFALLAGMSLMGLITSISLSFNSQIVFSGLFVCIAVYIRRYAGTLITLVLIGMAIIASTRYLYWRFDATLVRDFSIDFIFGFYLFVAECYLALLVSLGLIQSVWPLKRARAALPREQDEWPTVDVFILCYDQPYTAIKLTSIAAYKLDWPKKKIAIYLIDGGQRDDLRALAGSFGAHYLPHLDESGTHIDFIKLALPSTKGDLIAVFESGQAPDKSFLQSTVGWFLLDKKLGMVQPPHHFLALAPTKHDLEAFNQTVFVENCALLRRSVVLEIGLDGTEVREQSHLALKLQDAGYGCAYICFDVHERLINENKNAATESKLSPVPQIVLLEHPFFGRTLLWKQRISSLHKILQFYYFVPRLFFFTAPVVYLFGYTRIIQTAPELLAAYAVPHFLHAHIARSRTSENDRFTLVADVRETLLAWYILLPTTWTLLRTEFSQCCGLLTAYESDKIQKSDPLKLPASIPLLPYLFILSLNLAGFFGGIFQLLFSTASQHELTILYLLWATYNLTLLAAMLAVAEEAKQVRNHTRLRLQMPAMIKLPSGRTVSCATENFPESVLSLSLPMPVAVEEGSLVSISIFHGHRELVFPAMVVLRQGLTLRVTIADSSLNDFRTFATAAFSRGPEWPKWLPGRDADRPFPKWVTDALVAVPITIIDFITNISKHLHWTQLGIWIELWKQKK